MKTFRMTLSEKQMRIIKDALELRFRLDLCQGDELAEILATMNNLDLSPDNPRHKEIFDAYIDRRDHLNAVIDSLFEIASPRSFRMGGMRQRDSDSLIAEDIWQTIRYELFKATNPNSDEIGYTINYTVDSRPPLQVSGEDLPKIECVKEC